MNPSLTSSFAERQDQRSKALAIRDLAFTLFIETVRADGIPSSDEKLTERIERCYSAATAVTDYSQKQLEPFI